MEAADEIVLVALRQIGCVVNVSSIKELSADALVDAGFPVMNQTVLLRGINDDATTLEVFRKQTALHRSRGWTKAPERTDENIAAELVGVKINPVLVRVEGFGDGAASFSWDPRQAT
jgi:hypothetical protein